MSLESIEVIFPVNFCEIYAQVIYNPEFEDLMKIYSRPFFMYALDSYKNAKEINLGKERLQLETDKFKDRKKPVNDLFSGETIEQTPIQKNKSEKEIKPTLSIKERLEKKLKNK